MQLPRRVKATAEELATPWLGGHDVQNEIADVSTGSFLAISLAMRVRLGDLTF